MTIQKYTRAELGFSAHFMMQLDLDEVEQLIPMRICEVQRSLLKGLGEEGISLLTTPSNRSTRDFGVGDWVLRNNQNQIIRRLEPKSVLSRRAAGTDVSEQIIATNVDTLFIVSSCNADFNKARLERYLALAVDVEVEPIVLLTKADLAEDAEYYLAETQDLMSGLTVLALNATDQKSLEDVYFWCGEGQTVAMVGSSGVGKTTLLNNLTIAGGLTQEIREDDAKGRHTTTSRSLNPIVGGGWIIDTPGMRALRLYDKSEGIETVFDDVTSLARQCRFSDCQHETEPGCAVREAIDSGLLDSERLKRWGKLLRENNYNSETISQARKREKAFGKMVNRIQSENKARKGF
ncbi:MAG: ribosome small subunit-dependent GTPase A [Rhodospirillales bacterium]|nr:ribosome small subunit-dependent GTPase A [Rhodospirillales bacterium]